MRQAIIFVTFGFLLAGCASQDTGLRRQIIGGWSHGDSDEMLLLAKGSFIHKLRRPDGEGNFTGTWKVNDGVLALKTVHRYFSYRPGVTNITTFINFADIDPRHYRINLIDSTHLEVVDLDTVYEQLPEKYRGGKTSVWERKQ